jgi:hypothetical protein
MFLITVSSDEVMHIRGVDHMKRAMRSAEASLK